jgi:hypothetical protein
MIENVFAFGVIGVIGIIIGIWVFLSHESVRWSVLSGGISSGFLVLQISRSPHFQGDFVNWVWIIKLGLVGFIVGGLLTFLVIRFIRLLKKKKS